MPVRAVIFDIGGVLELAHSTDWLETWRARCGAVFEEAAAGLEQMWEAGSLGAVSLQDLEQRIAELLGLDEAELSQFMGDLWGQYLGTLNEELAGWFAALRPRYRTGF